MKKSPILLLWNTGLLVPPKMLLGNHRIPHEDALVLGRLFYDSSHKSITMVNLNTCLGRCVFLLGHSKKPNREEVIGKFGEWFSVGSSSRDDSLLLMWRR